MSDDFSDIAKMDVHELLDYVIGNPNYLADSYYRATGRAICARARELQPRPGCELTGPTLPRERISELAKRAGYPVTLDGYVRLVRLVEGELQLKAAPDGQDPA